MLTSKGLFLKNNKFPKNKKRSRISKRFRKWSLVGLILVLCFTLAVLPVFAASSGREHHKDTIDYCIRVHDVIVGLQELEGKSESEKIEIVESASKYSIYIYGPFTERSRGGQFTIMRQTAVK